MAKKRVAKPKPQEIAVRIPPALAKEFGRDLRVVVRHPWIVGIPVPMRLLKGTPLEAIAKERDIFITP